MSLDDERSTAVKVASNGRITIPKGLRRFIGLQDDIEKVTEDPELVKIQFESIDGDNQTASSFLEVTASGRVTIPEGVREYLGLEEGDLVKIEVEYPAPTD